MGSVLHFGVKAVLAATLCLNAGATEHGFEDAEFGRVPFAEWLAGARQDHIRWSVEVVPPELSTHQRMLLRIAVRLDRRELTRRDGPGEFVALFQYEDASGRVWRTHGSLDPGSAQPERTEIRLNHYAFLLPGDYSIAIAIWHSTTGQHALVRRKVHVSEIANDPLPEAWRGLPAVEFIRNTADTPDVWYLPDIRSKLNLRANNSRPVHVEILVNTTPSESSAGSPAAIRRNMSLVVPALKALTEIELRQGTLDVSLLDLTHRKITFSQKDARKLDWDRMRKVFVETNPGVVDVATLQNQWKMRRFFWDEMSRRVEDKHDSPHVVIVLSGPAFMLDQEPFEADPLPADPDHKLLYIRYRNNPGRYFGQRGAHPGARPLPHPAQFLPMPVDDLERTVQPMNARLYDAISAEQFRRVLGSVVEQIARF